MHDICVLGSINMDLVLKVNAMPALGETILSKNFNRIPGGKGANQALAAQRLGSSVSMISSIGKDENGRYMLECLKKDGMDTRCINFSEDKPTGMAIIMVDDNANNSIVVVPGANMKVDKELIDKSFDTIVNSKILIAQFETPIETTIEAFKVAKKSDVITVLNPAPAKSISDDLLRMTDILVPNESEIFELTGIKVDDKESIRNACDKLLQKGVKFIIVTLGERGAVLVNSEKLILIPAYKVKAIDTTAAGDSFIGALATKILKYDKLNFENIEKSIKFANKVSSIVVQRAGAQSSLPYLNEVTNVYGEE